MGVVGTLLNLIIRPGASHFLGFAAATVMFNFATAIIGYENVFNRGARAFSLVVVSVTSTTVASINIGPSSS